MGSTRDKKNLSTPTISKLKKKVVYGIVAREGKGRLMKLKVEKLIMKYFIIVLFIF